MQNDIQVLEQMNIRIGIEESKGDDDSFRFLDSVIAPKFAFSRADGKTIDGRDEFLKKIALGDPRETEVQSIELLGNRAFVTCIVTVHSANGNKSFHNVRLFVRLEGQWKVLGWANEPM